MKFFNAYIYYVRILRDCVVAGQIYNNVKFSGTSRNPGTSKNPIKITKNIILFNNTPLYIIINNLTKNN